METKEICQILNRELLVFFFHLVEFIHYNIILFILYVLTNLWFFLKIISGLHNFDKDNVASVVTAADKVLYFIPLSFYL